MEMEMMPETLHSSVTTPVLNAWFSTDNNTYTVAR